ncbi:MAG: hypothetical protein LC107_05050 [Chitinophagales bacterium]|nr:hypothetical protein [Chitinophagales bacterium]
MKHRFSRATKLYGILIVFFISIACGGYFNIIEYYSLFYPEVSNRPENAQVYFFTEYYPYGEDYNYNYKMLDKQKEIIVDEWFHYFNKKFSKEVLKEEIYTNPVLSPEFVNSLEKSGYNDALQYFVDTKKLDKTIKPRAIDSWHIQEKTNAVAIKSMVGSLEKKIIQSKDKFIQERYLFQLLKAYGSIDAYDQIIALYIKYNKKVYGNTIVSDLLASRYAGAFYHLNEFDKSYYLFAQVFNDRPHVAHYARGSARSYDIPFSEKALQYCANDTEKANVYSFLALQNDHNVVHALEKVFQYNPNHKMLELICTRAINQIEHYYFERDFYTNYKLIDDESQFSMSKVQAKGQISKLQKIITQISQTKPREALDFYHLANSYLYYLTGEYTIAQNHLAQVKNINNLKNTTKQKWVLELVLALANNPKYTEKQFSRVFDNIECLRDHVDTIRDISVITYVAEVMEHYFAKNGQGDQYDDARNFLASTIGTITSKDAYWTSIEEESIGKQIFARDYNNNRNSPFHNSRIRKLLEEMDIKRLEGLIRFFEDKHLNVLDMRLKNLTHINIEELYMAYGRKLMLRHRFEEASVAFGKLSRDFIYARFTLMYTKPNINLKTQTFNPILNPVKYVEYISELDKKAKANTKDAETWYLLGEAMVNISYHGQAWHFSKRYRSIYDPMSGSLYGEVVSRKDAINYNYFFLVEAKNCLKKANSLSNDQELKAKISYLNAFIQKETYHALYPEYNYLDTEREIRTQRATGNRFADLLDYYKNTKYAKMLLKECHDYYYLAKD